MVLPTGVTIKRENDDFESNSEDVPNVCPGPEYDIKVEIEVSGSHLGFANQWAVKSEINETDFEYSFGDDCGLSYEYLTDYIEQKCSFCCEKFCESYSLLRHNLKHLKLQLEPIDLQKYVCTICNQHFINKSSLDKHIEITHRTVGNKKVMNRDGFKITKMLHQCKICGKIQNYKTWHSHMKEVHGIGRYECSVCKATFKCRRYLRNHMTCTHLAQKIESIIPCPQCPAKLKCKNALTTHMRNCHSEKVQCDICLSVLKCKSYLCAHMRRVHYVDGKEHKCHCGKSFRSSRYLKVHIRNAHTRR